MRSVVAGASLSLLLLVFFGCSKDDDTALIYPFESYRYDLWTKMLDGNNRIDFVGTQIDPYEYPNYLNKAFDGDHQGVGSIETDGVIISLSNVLLSIDAPDVVLLGIGINDLLAEDSPGEIIKNVGIIIDILQNNHPNMTIFVEQIPPLRSDLMTLDLTRRLIIYNRMIAHLSDRKSNPTSRVISIDMFTNFIDRYFADQVHYNTEGANFVSQKYYDAIIEHCVLDGSLKVLPLGDSRVVGFRD